MKQVIFATTNERKIREATETLTPFDIEIEAQTVDAEEIQHHDPAEITKAKAKAAYDILQKPVVVQDTTWEIPALHGFPGGYMKDVSIWFQPEDWLALMERHEDRTIICHENVAYYDGDEIHLFQSDYNGQFIHESRGNSYDSIEKVVVLYDNQTMSEMHDQGKISSAGLDLQHWKQFGEWYAGQSE